MVKQKTFCKNKNYTLLDALPTNKPNCFQETVICVTDLSDCNKLVITIFRSKFINLSPQSATYKSYKSFNGKKAVYKLDQKLIQGHIYITDNWYSILTGKFFGSFRKRCSFKIKNYQKQPRTSPE